MDYPSIFKYIQKYFGIVLTVYAIECLAYEMKANFYHALLRLAIWSIISVIFALATVKGRHE